MKWAMIAFMVVMLGSFIGMVLEQYGQNECRVAAIQAGKNSTEITAICK